MEMAVWNRPADAQIDVIRSSSLEFIQNTREYLDKCVPLYKLALKGDWKAAKPFIDGDGRLRNAAITKGWSTLLHVAAGANQVHFVEELVKLLEADDLGLQDFNGNTAFCLAAAAGNLRITKILMDKNDSLPTMRGAGGRTALHMAALQGRNDMARHLYSSTIDTFKDESDWIVLFFVCIKSGIYDLALEMLEREPILLALARDASNESGLHILALKTSDFSSEGGGGQHGFMNLSTKSTLFLQLVRCLWNIILHLDEPNIEMRTIISEPWQVIFGAVKVGNFEFLVELLKVYPDLIWELDDRNRTMIHIAVLHRHTKIFNLIHGIGSIKDVIVTFVDDQQNNMLHCAARLAPPAQLSSISGSAFQMTHELIWFEEVKKAMLPPFIEMKNCDGLTPRQLFTKEHEALLNRAESWMKRTANSGMVVSTLITTGVFTAAFTLPGGNNIRGIPIYLKSSWFLLFAISDATALISSATSILIFLSILVSRYAEDDFLKSLPLKLISGLVTLFIAIVTMMLAFSCSFFIAYDYGSQWVPDFIFVLAFLPVSLFLFLQLPLCSDILYSTYYCKSLFRPTKHLLN